MTEPTSQKLADALREAGFDDLADRALNDEFHDYKTPHEMPQHLLVEELRKFQHDDELSIPAAKMAKRVIDGEFDASREESDAWAASPEGQEALRSLVGDVPREATDPRDLGGSIVDTTNDPMARGGVVMDARKAILVDSLDVCKIDDWSTRNQSVFAVVAEGRINQSQERAAAFLAGDLDFKAAVITQMHGVAERAGELAKLHRLCADRWNDMPHPGRQDA